MLSGPDLGAALKRAMQMKGVTQKDVASHFGVQQPSVSEWIRFGRIKKTHIDELVSYFSSHVGPEHWGLSQLAGSQPAGSGSVSASATIHQPAVLTIAQAVDLIGDLLVRFDDAARERVALRLQTLSRAPDSPNARTKLVAELSALPAHAETADFAGRPAEASPAPQTTRPDFLRR